VVTDAPPDAPPEVRASITCVPRHDTQMLRLHCTAVINLLRQNTSACVLQVALYSDISPVLDAGSNAFDAGFQNAEAVFSSLLDSTSQAGSIASSMLSAASSVLPTLIPDDGASSASTAKVCPASGLVSLPFLASALGTSPCTDSGRWCPVRVETYLLCMQGPQVSGPSDLLAVKAAAAKPGMSSVKQHILQLVRATSRGVYATADEVAAIEEVAVSLETQNPSNVTVR
jgi:hypothetical protein